jgi:hypothetical protein
MGRLPLNTSSGPEREAICLRATGPDVTPREVGATSDGTSATEPSGETFVKPAPDIAHAAGTPATDTGLPDDARTPSSGQAHRSQPPAARRVQVALSLVTLALIAAVAAVGLFVSQETAIATNPALPLAARVDAARRMMRMRPFSDSAEVRYAILRGRQLFVAEKWDEAQALLYETYLRNIGDKPLRAELRRVNLAVEFRDAAKAHRQHGHEGPGGTLRPEDVER